MIWLNDIRWKYFTNEKAGLIFKELTKEFRIVYKMTENKRYEKRMNFNVSLPDERCFKNEYCIVDEAKDRYEALSINELVDRLNEQEETIQSLKKELFESEKNYIIETYSDNPIRRDEKIQSLKEEFKARFGDVE